MAEQINYNQLYEALTPLEQQEYAGYKIARNLVPSERETQDYAFPDFKEILDAEAAAASTKPSMWNPINWLFPPAASAEKGIPATSAAQQYFDYYSKYGDNYSDLKIPGWEKQHMQNQRFKQQQLMNRRKQQMQQTIRQHEAAEAAKQKAAAEAQAQAQAQASANAAAAGQRRAGKGGTHMSRSIDQGGLGISQAQAQAVSDANKEAGLSGWGLADGGLINFYRYGGFSG